ncbi:hypothetical protein AALP_AA7G030400 [Arabis alpina]|uniref:NYN domain-containing protein n=1 Tax=Arabis alpina TaxID=50452 RepID=A0A087GFL4_ARAAL|nr:hypothetical protein AALP_AA7G030400 [Arabis alpina]
MALKEFGYNGNVSIKAYGETDDIKDQFIKAGINPIHVTGDTIQRVKSIIVDMYAWVLNPHASVVMFILGDISRDVGFVNELAELSVRNFRILLCQPPSATGLLFIPTNKVWRWDSLALGGPSISETEHIKLVEVNNPRSYYVNQPEAWKHGLDSDDEIEEGMESEEENLESPSSPLASRSEYMSEIKRLKDVIQERDAKILEMEKKQEELKSVLKSIREVLQGAGKLQNQM